MGLFDTPTRFVLDGAEYQRADIRPLLAPGSVRRMVAGGEPRIIAQVPLIGSGTVEVHGYATHYNQQWVTIVWTDDTYQHLHAWVPVADVRRPGDGEWRGKYVQF